MLTFTTFQKQKFKRSHLDFSKLGYKHGCLERKAAMFEVFTGKWPFS